MARTRTFRRYQYELRKTRQRRKYRRQWDLFELLGFEVTDFMLGFHANTPHPCSGHCCGNPRKWFGTRTLQERRSDYWSEDEW